MALGDPSLDSEKFRCFLSALARAQKKADTRRKKSAPVEKHIKKVKDLPYSNKLVKTAVVSELDELRKKIDTALKDETEMKQHQVKEDEVLLTIKKEIAHVDKRFSQFRDHFESVIGERDHKIGEVSECVERLDSLLKAGMGKRIIALEKKIRKTVGEEAEEVEELSKRIKKLELHLDVLEGAESHPKTDLARVKKKIGLLKKKLDDLE
jgi:chromosome segregation ATPase